jgi:hypothetical protein
MNEQTKDMLAIVLNNVLEKNESSFEATVDRFGIDSDEAIDHVYTIARNLLCELEIDL